MSLFRAETGCGGAGGYRARLKMHGGGPKVTAGQPLDKAYTEENLDLLQKGLEHLFHHIGIASHFGIPTIVAINRFITDTDAELELIQKAVRASDQAEDCVITNHWEEGGAGAIALAQAVVKAAEKPADFQFLYPLDQSIKQKIETIAREVYGADGVDYSPEAERKIAEFTKLGYADLPICMAKTHLSLSHDATLKGVPRAFRFPIRIFAFPLGRVSCIHWQVRSAPCRGCPPGRHLWISTSIRKVAGSWLILVLINVVEREGA
jgi:formyltetrahydrofolate synthetase